MLCSMMHPLAPHALAPMELLDALMHDALEAHDALVSPALPATPRLSSTADAHTVSLVAPGLAPSDVIIEAHPDGRLTIRGENMNKRKLDWSIALPLDADTEEASAEVADGLITVSVKRVKPETAEIDVSTEPVTDEEDESYTFSLVAAGFAAADLALSVDGGLIKVKGESARTGALLERHVRLPRDAEATAAHASHVDGILTVSVPKKAAAQPRRVPVNAEASSNEEQGTAKATETEEIEEEAVMV